MPSASETNGTHVPNGNGVTAIINGENGVKQTNGVKETNGLKTNGNGETKSSRTLNIPDLFGGILSGDPVENPLEPTIGPLSEEWTKAYVVLT